MSIKTNPWQVPSLDEYLYYCCPECELRTKEYKLFFNHAVALHQSASVLLEEVPETSDPLEVSEDIVVKEEYTETTDEVVIDNKRKFEPDSCIEEEGPLNKKVKTNEVQCYYCGYITENTTVIEDHIRDKHNSDVTNIMHGLPRDHQCEQCKVVFISEEILKVHLCGITNPSIKLCDASVIEVCDQCGLEFKGHRSLLYHYAAKHSTEKKFDCDLCDYKFYTLSSLRTHKKAVHQGSTVCDTCGRAFKSLITLRKHEREVHLGAKRKQLSEKCKLCEFRSLSRPVLRQHMSDEHPDYNPYLCEDCGKSFSMKTYFTVHLRSKQCTKKSTVKVSTVSKKVKKVSKKVSKVSNEVSKVSNELSNEVPYKEDNFKCDHCGIKFSTKLQLKSHVWNAHTQKFFICTLCEKVIHSRKKLKKHYIESHSKRLVKDEVLACEHCDMKFETSEEFNEHQKLQHQLSSEHYCDQCGKTFASTIILQAHKMECHNYNPLNPQYSQSFNTFKCDLCPKRLKSKGTLRAHRKELHEKEIHKHFCQDCEFTAYYLNTLKDHISTNHSPMIRLQCDHCAYTTLKKKDLQHHLLNEHDII